MFSSRYHEEMLTHYYPFPFFAHANARAHTNLSYTTLAYMDQLQNGNFLG